MSAVITKALLEQQVELTKPVLAQLRGMDQHLLVRVQPHLDDAGKKVTGDLLEALDIEDGINPNLALFLDVAIAEIRAAIATGTTVEQVAIPRHRLIGCTEASEAREVLSPAAEGLQAALPPLVSLYGAARQALDHAGAIRFGIRLIGQD